MNRKVAELSSELHEKKMLLSTKNEQEKQNIKKWFAVLRKKGRR